MWPVRSVRTFALALVAGVFLAPGTSPTNSGIGFTKAAYAGSAVVGGRRMQCSRAKVRFSSQSPGVGFAVPGEIVFNRRLLRQYPSVTRRMIFLHECAHQYVGADEVAADCWAIRNAKRQGWLSEKGVRTVCRSFAGSRGGRGHLPGAERCAAMLKCFHTGSPGITVRRGTLRGRRAHDAR